jgi:hypothetical protein
VNADPDPAFQMNADPDPAFQMNADPDPGFQMNSDPVTINIFIPITLIFYTFSCVFFLLQFSSWIRIRIPNADLDPDPGDQLNADPCGSGSETLESPRVSVTDLTGYNR